jgi:hypothetical protein
VADCEDNVQYSSSASRTDSNPTLLIGLCLVLQKNVVSGQNVFRVRATDTVFRKMPFIVFVPVELAGFLHSMLVYIKCTYTATRYVVPRLPSVPGFGRKESLYLLVFCHSFGTLFCSKDWR